MVDVNKGSRKRDFLAISEDIEVMFDIGRTSPVICTVYGAEIRSGGKERE